MFNLRRFCVGAALGLSLLACGPAQANPILTNGSFEATVSNAITGWSIDQYASANGVVALTFSSALAHGGRGLAILGGGLLPNPMYGSIGQKLSGIQVGGRYRISGYVDLVTPGAVLTSIGFSTYGFGHDTWATPVLGSPTARGYRPFGGTVTATNTREYVYFYVKANSPSAVQLDDLSVTKLGRPLAPSAPEVDPQAGAPALALALGGLALMSQRRRKQGDSNERCG